MSKAPKGALRAWILDNAPTSESDDCLLAPYGSGRPQFTHDGVWWRASHFVLDIMGQPRPLPPHNHSLHSCDNDLCLNPRHLRWGSNTENISDRVGRGRSLRGSACSWARLTEDDVRSIRSLYPNETYAHIAERFNVHAGTVVAIVQRRSWGWVA